MSATKEKPIHRTAYPHIVKVEGIGGVDAVIEGTRMAVWHIAGYYYKVGMSVEEILHDFPHLRPEQVFAALAYYHDNKEEVDQVAYENSYEYWKEKYGSNAPQPAPVVSQRASFTRAGSSASPTTS